MTDTDYTTEPAFDAAAAVGASICGCKIGVISLIDETRQWFHATFGLFGVTVAPREIGLCVDVIASEGVMVCTDLQTDPTYRDNPLAQGSTPVRFLAAVRISGRARQILGVLCLMDPQPRQLGDAQRSALRHLANVVSTLIDARAARETLRSTHESLSAIVNTSPVAIYAYDRAGHVTLWNPASERLFGWRAAEAIGRRLPLVGEADQAEFDRMREDALNGCPIRNLHLIRQRRDGTAVDILASTAPLRDAHGNAVGVMAVTVDVTEQIRLDRKLRQQLRFTQELIEAIPNPVYFKSREGRYIGFNRAWERYFGIQREDLLAKFVKDLFPGELARLHQQKDDELYREMKPQVFETKVPIHGGEWRDVIYQKSVFTDDNQEVVGLIGVITDITDRKAVEDSLRTSEERFRLITENASDLIAMLDLEGRRVYNSPSYHALFGEESLVPGASSFDQIHPDDRKLVSEVFQETITTGVGRTARFRFRLPDGSIRHIESRGNLIRDAGGRPFRVVVVSRDVTERLSTEERLHYLAHHDLLTELPNRALFVERLRHAVDRAKRAMTGIAVMFVDLDDFKDVNDTLGHPAGDQLLKTAARRLREGLREGDTVARQGGDEFIVLIEDAGPADLVVNVGRKIVERLSEPYVLGSRDVRISASVGIALYPQHGTDSEELLKHSDLALYHAKGEGKGRCAIFAAAMSQALEHRYRLETEIREALEQNRFVLHYQPRFSLANGKMTCVEALVRWPHPTLGLLGPMQFIPQIEQTEQIQVLGAWVLREACSRVVEWQRRGCHELSVSVNVASKQFQREEFVAGVMKTVTQLGLAPERLEIEITESAIMQNVELTASALDRLRGHGVRIAIDDFGTGYSSLGYLKRFPIDRVKIDRSFVQDLLQESSDLAIVKAILAMAESLDFSVTAEGIETPDQLALLTGLGCEEGQGFLLGRPLSVADFEREWLDRQLDSAITFEMPRFSAGMV